MGFRRDERECELLSPFEGRASQPRNTDFLLELAMATSNQGVRVTIPSEVWQNLMEVRAQLDSQCPGAPTPVEEMLREVVNHYKHCSKAMEESDDFCKRAQAWKKGT